MKAGTFWIFLYMPSSKKKKPGKAGTQYMSVSEIMNSDNLYDFAILCYLELILRGLWITSSLCIFLIHLF